MYKWILSLVIAIFFVGAAHSQDPIGNPMPPLPCVPPKTDPINDKIPLSGPILVDLYNIKRDIAGPMCVSNTSKKTQMQIKLGDYKKYSVEQIQRYESIKNKIPDDIKNIIRYQFLSRPNPTDIYNLNFLCPTKDADFCYDTGKEAFDNGNIDVALEYMGYSVEYCYQGETVLEFCDMFIMELEGSYCMVDFLLAEYE